MLENNTNNSLLISNSENDVKHIVLLLNLQMQRAILPVIVFIGIVTFIGIVGNILILLIYGRRQEGENFRCFVLMMAAIDLTSCITTLSGEIYSLLNWYDSPYIWMCKEKTFFNVFTSWGSAWVLFLLAIERYRKICRPLRWQIRTSLAMKLCILFLIISATVGIPVAIVWGKHTYEHTNLSSEKVEETFQKLDLSVLKRFVFPVNVSEKEIKEEASISAPFHIFRKDGKVHVYCTSETICDVGFEFPQWNYTGYNGRKYKYVYGVGIHTGEKMTTSVVKINVDSKTYEQWSEVGCYVSEPVFIADPGGTMEDHGVLLVAVNKVHVDESRSCFLLVLDATNMTSLAKVEFKGLDNFPRDFHGLFKSEIGETK